MDKVFQEKEPRGASDPRIRQVRLVGEDGEKLGIVSMQAALDLALTRNCDLVEIAAEAEPPVYKLTDQNRLKYQKQKKRHELRKKQKAVVVKEIQIRPNIQEHDYQVKMSGARRFLEAGDRVRVVLQFRGREVNFLELGKKVMDRFLTDLEGLGKVEMMPKLEGKRLIGVLSALKGTVPPPPPKSLKEPKKDTENPEPKVPEPSLVPEKTQTTEVGEVILK